MCILYHILLSKRPSLCSCPPAIFNNPKVWLNPLCKRPPITMQLATPGFDCVLLICLLVTFSLNYQPVLQLCGGSWSACLGEYSNYLATCFYMLLLYIFHVTGGRWSPDLLEDYCDGQVFRAHPLFSY